MKLLFFILAVLLLLICFLLHFMKSSCFNVSFIFSLFKQSHNQSGYSLSSRATGSSPLFFTFKFKTVPALHEDCIAKADECNLATWVRTANLNMLNSPKIECEKFQCRILHATSCRDLKKFESQRKPYIKYATKKEGSYRKAHFVGKTRKQLEVWNCWIGKCGKVYILPGHHQMSIG